MKNNLFDWRIILLISVITFIGIGGKLRVVGAVLILAFAIFRFVKWEHLFYTGLVLLPVKTIFTTDVGFHMQLSQLFLFSAICGALISNSRLVLRQGPFDVRVITCFFVLVISSFQSFHIPPDSVVILGAFRNYPWIKSLGRTFFVGMLIFLVFFMRSYAYKKEIFNKLLKMLIISATVYSSIGLIEYAALYLGFRHPLLLGTILESGERLPRIQLFDSEPLYFGAYLLTITPLIICLAIRGESYLIKNSWLWFFSFINVSAIILTHSRGAWAGLVSAVVFLIILNYKKILINIKELFSTRLASRFLVPMFLIIFALVFAESIDEVFIKQIRDAFDPKSGPFWSTRIRLTTIMLGLEAFYSHPLLGIGFENFSFYAGNVFIPTLIDFAINYPETNNLLFKILVETGIIGFVIISFMFLKSFVDLVKRMSDTKNDCIKTILQGYLACTIGILVQFLFFSNVFPIYLWIMLGMILSAVNLAENANY